MNRKDFDQRPGRPVRVPENHPRPADEGDDWFYPATRAERRANPGYVGLLISPSGAKRALFSQTRQGRTDA